MALIRDYSTVLSTVFVGNLKIPCYGADFAGTDGSRTRDVHARVGPKGTRMRDSRARDPGYHSAR